MCDQQNERCSCAPFNIEEGFLKRGYSNNFFIVNNVRPLIYLCYLLLPNLLFDVLHRWMVLRLTGGRKLLCLPISAKTRDS